MTATPSPTRTPKPVRSSGTFTLGAGSDGATTVHRLGYGAMQITGPGIWGEPVDHDECIRVLRRPSTWGSTSSTPPTPTGPR